MKVNLDLAEFRTFNVARSEAPLTSAPGALHPTGGFGQKLDDWSPAEYGNALAGEVGELCNLLKKMRRGDNVDLLRVADEAGDVLVYLDLLTARVGISLAQATVRKWDYVSMERNYEPLLSSRKYKGAHAEEALVKAVLEYMREGDKPHVDALMRKALAAAGVPEPQS